jgi:hypothetical protein
MESTVSMNSQPTHEIDSKIWVMTDAWNRELVLSDEWRMELTPKTNSWLTHEINRENRVIVDK